MAATKEPPVAHQFEAAEQQHLAATLGMWVFLATEVLFFGGLFLAYTVYRLRYPEAFAGASRHTLVTVGTINTAVLIVSSFCVALAVRAVTLARRKQAAGWLLATALLGTMFLGLKALEYRTEIHEGLLPGPGFHLEGVAEVPARLFFTLYFFMTGLHAVHVAIGVVALLIFGGRLWRTTGVNANAVEVLGLYWHFVDLVWVFLFPLLYLMGRSA